MSGKNSGSTAESVPMLKRIGKRVLRVPGSKSLTSRAIVLGALSAGRSVIRRPLKSEDTTLLVDAMAAIGVGVKWGEAKLILHGVDGKPPHGASVYLGAGGTPSRFMIATGSLASDRVTVDGDGRMRQRPIGELLTMLRLLGVKFDSDNLPVTVDGSCISGGSIDVPITKSSQFISALMLIAPFVDGGIELDCRLPLTSEPYVDLTIDVLKTFGVAVQSSTSQTHRIITVPQTRITHREVEIEPDASSAVYFAAVAALHEGMTITLEGLKLTSKQPDMKAICLLGESGADVQQTDSGVQVTGTGTMRGFGDIDASEFPDASLCIAAVAAFADSASYIYGLETLPLKESDRIEVMARSLASVGCGVAASENALRITPIFDAKGSVAIDPAGDHRIAMAMAVVGTKRGDVSITDTKCVAKSYPTFWSDLRRIYEGREES
ncbi:MAG: 3-phosphoshikimate 1-carboxyvinyltransferase [Planctomycetota bacterium]|nr:3-phosphoshikimate 1-carboxyvinyltransferase [Planctomycetota bacterium]